MNARNFAHAMMSFIAAVAGSVVVIAQTEPIIESKVEENVRVNVINVEVVVSDSNGRYVKGLVASDFAVHEDGRQMLLTNFFESESGASALSEKTAISTEQEQQPLLTELPTSEDMALSLVIFVDNANIAYTGRKAVIESVANSLGRILHPGDRVMVVSYNLSRKVFQSFTTDSEKAAAARNPHGLVITVGEPAAGKGRRMLIPLVMKVPAAKLTLLPQGGVAEGNVTFCFMVKDERGRYSDPKSVKFPLRVPTDRLDAILNHDAFFTFRLMMREGKHDVAVTLRDDTTEEVSTVITEVVVPSRSSLKTGKP